MTVTYSTVQYSKLQQYGTVAWYWFVCFSKAPIFYLDSFQSVKMTAGIYLVNWVITEHIIFQGEDSSEAESWDCRDLHRQICSVNNPLFCRQSKFKLWFRVSKPSFVTPVQDLIQILRTQDQHQSMISLTQQTNTWEWTSATKTIHTTTR